MPRSAGMVHTEIWRDPEFIALSGPAQRLYMFLLSQPNLTNVGVLPLTVKRWCACGRDLSEPAIVEALGELEAARFIVTDLTAEELLVRSLMRNDEVWRKPYISMAAAKEASEVSSHLLRHELLTEIQRIAPLIETVSDKVSDKTGKSPREVVAAAFDRMANVLRKGLPNRSENPSGNGSGNGTPNPQRALAPSPYPLAPSPPPGGAQDAPPLVTEQPLPTEIEAVAAIAVADIGHTAVAAFIEGALGAGLDRPRGALPGRVGKQAKQLFAEGVPRDRIEAAARSCGAQGWSDLAVELQRMDARRSGAGPPRLSTVDQRVAQGLDLAERLRKETG